MILSLKEIEPFNIPPVDNEKAALFMRRLTGNETVEFSGQQKPKCMMIYDLKYNYPRHSYAQGWLLSIDVDDFTIICESGNYPNMEPIMKKYLIGTIGIEFGGNLEETKINAHEMNLD